MKRTQRPASAKVGRWVPKELTMINLSVSGAPRKPRSGREGGRCLNHPRASPDFVPPDCNRAWGPFVPPGGTVSHGLARRRFLREGLKRSLPLSRVVTTVVNARAVLKPTQVTRLVNLVRAVVRAIDVTAEVRAVGQWARKGTTSN